MGKALLLRVGMDRGTGGALGPIFRNGTFEYIPIPELCPTRCRVSYATQPGRQVASLATVLPARLAGRHPHIDPDFETATYGDAAQPKRQQLGRLEPGDRLVFYSGFIPAPPDDGAHLFAIGSLHVRHVHHLSAADFDRPELQRRFGHTAHFLRQPRDPQLVLVEGDPERSTLLLRARPLADACDCMLRDLAPLGYHGSLRRAVGHWIAGGESIKFLESWLRRGPASLVDGQTRLIPVAASALQCIQKDGDLVIAEKQVRDGDWVVAISRGRTHIVHALARINRIVPAARGPLGLCSLYWRFSPGMKIAARPAEAILTAGGTSEPVAAIRQLVSWFTGHFRGGSHLGADPLSLANGLGVAGQSADNAPPAGRRRVGERPPRP
ncbi:MAG: hypothetical protein ACREFO_02160 [Acetobacteraceae bacterium]